MEAAQLVNKYLRQAKVMQIATVHEGKPWICSVYYVADGQKLYWLSWPSRRHSQEISVDSKAAIAIVVDAGQPVIGIQAEGVAREITDPAEVERIAAVYVATHGVGKQFAANFAAGTNQHHMYCFVPEKMWLFDEKHFPDSTRHEVAL